jgi:hypothetical protein
MGYLTPLLKEGMRTDITQADAVDDVCPVLAYISTKPEARMNHRVVIKLIDFTATSDDYIALFECVCVFVHIYNVTYLSVKRKFYFRQLKHAPHAIVLREYFEDGRVAKLSV